MGTAFAGSWSSLPTQLTPWIFDVIQSMGHSQMTPVQASTIPLFMRHKDVVVEAVTGSGKTLAFVVPILEKLACREQKLKPNEVGALVLSPTRYASAAARKILIKGSELATQIHDVFSLFLSSQLQSQRPPLLLVSSSDSSPAQDLQRFLDFESDIVIGTPGRIEEFLLGKGRTSVSVKELEVLVLDEADRLLDLGFQTTITRIITYLPKQRRTGLFSATMTDALSELVRVGLRNPARVVVKVHAKRNQSGVSAGQIIEERRIPANLQNYFIPCRAPDKLIELVRIINFEVSQHQSSYFIVYFSTGACVDYFYRILPAVLPQKTKLHSLHGRLPPNARTRSLSAFASAITTPDSPCILLTTDVAARGLDLPHVDVVIQFDPPTDPKAFSHRCGRTARAGRSGRAWVLLVGREIEYVDFMTVRKIPLQEHPPLDTGGRSLGETVASSFTSRIRDIVLADRTIHDLALKAFVSFVHAYSKHEASFIFRLKDLDLVGLAKCFALLRLPRMPELKGSSLEEWQDFPVNWETYKYADAAQEAKRLAPGPSSIARLDQHSRDSERAKKAKSNAPWSDKVAKKIKKDKRKEKGNNKKKRLREKESTDSDSKRSLSPVITRDDWDELAREERMAKKLKRGEISSAQFDAEFASLV